MGAGKTPMVWAFGKLEVVRGSRVPQHHTGETVVIHKGTQALQAETRFIHLYQCGEVRRGAGHAEGSLQA